MVTIPTALEQGLRMQRNDRYPCPALGGKRLGMQECKQLSATVDGNKQCDHLGCRCSWRICPICIKHVPTELLVAIGDAVQIDSAFGTCYYHHLNGPSATPLSMPAIREKFAGQFPRAFDKLPVIECVPRRERPRGWKKNNNNGLRLDKALAERRRLELLEAEVEEFEPGENSPVSQDAATQASIEQEKALDVSQGTEPIILPARPAVKQAEPVMHPCRLEKRHIKESLCRLKFMFDCFEHGCSPPWFTVGVEQLAASTVGPVALALQPLSRKNFEPFTPLELARRFKILRTEFGYNLKQIAEIYGKSVCWVSNYLRLLNPKKLDQRILQFMERGTKLSLQIGYPAALKLMSIPLDRQWQEMLKIQEAKKAKFM